MEYCWMLLVCLIYFHDAFMRASAARKIKTAHAEGDIILGALFPIHNQPSVKSAFTRQCGDIWTQYGIHRIETFFMVIDEINASNDILPNITLGYDIRDSCWYSPIALENSIDFIKNSIASQETLNSNVSSNSSCGNRGQPIAALIGPGSSSVTIQVANLLQLFRVPQIGYSATSQDLSSRDFFEYFLRVVPSDAQQARALLDMVLNHNWTYVSTVATLGNYGQSGMQTFKKMANEIEGFCIADSIQIANNAELDDYIEAIEKLYEDKNAKVVVCFCEGRTVKSLFRAIKVKGIKNHFVIVGSDGWNVRPEVVRGVEEYAQGSFSIRLHSPPVVRFDKRFMSLRPFNNSRNPWFQEYWQYSFNCSIKGPDFMEKFRNKSCTGHEDRSACYVPDAKLGFVVNAIWTLALGLHSVQQTVCKGKIGTCPGLLPINGTILKEHLMNVSFTTYTGEVLTFDSHGDPPGRYDIMNFRPIRLENGTVKYIYREVGQWDRRNLTMNRSAIYWHRNGEGVVSVCSRPCPKGQVKVINQAKPCCWDCNPCKDDEYLVDESTCRPCSKGWWPTKDLTACVMIPIEHIQWTETQSVIAMVFSCIGIFTTVCIIVCFLRHNDTPVVKASTRELTYIILIGLIISYATTYVLIAKPSITTCYISRILPGFSFSLIFGALVTKTNRIARILAGSKKKIMTRKPRFMSSSAQVVITCIIIGVECAVITIMLVLEPADSMLQYPGKKRVRLVCNTTKMGIIVPLGFDVILIALCTLYAIRTRNVPENFNEAKFIGFTMYTTCIIWLAFVPIYFGSDNQVITMCIAISLSATVALVLLFFPKVYIILCQPEKNNRSAFTTSRDIRCHIGSQLSYGNRSYDNSNDSVERQDKTFEDTAISFWKTKSILDKWREKTGKGGKVSFKSEMQQGHHHNKSSPFIKGSSSEQNVFRLSPKICNRPRFDGIPLHDIPGAGHQRTPGLQISGSPRPVIRTSVDREFNDLNVPTPYRSRSVSPKIRAHRNDMSCQTDDSLFESYYLSNASLRKRHSAKHAEPTSSWTDDTSTGGRSKQRLNSSVTSSKASLRVHPPPVSETEPQILINSPGLKTPETYHSEHHPLLREHGLFDSDLDDIEDDGSRRNSAAICDDFFYDSFFDPPPAPIDFQDRPTKGPIRIKAFPNSPTRYLKTNGPQILPERRQSSPRPSASNATSSPSHGLVLPNKHSNKDIASSRSPSLSLRSTRSSKIMDNTSTNSRVAEIESVSPVPITTRVTVADQVPAMPSTLPLRHLPIRPRPDTMLSTDSDMTETPPQSADEMSLNDLRLLEEEEQSVEQFGEYLQTKGIKLDLSSVQSSDV
ncbi:metabotropic glutamate receptor 5-like [Tubulanus polymorphus]|uniref:metabotropic glutamate receptor 5-like n=1 Tax=Tubulanus polymorphus TaxID=672921 RepID=UPI003DA62854